MDPKRVLIVGKSPLVLETAAKLLEERGYAAATTNNSEEDITSQLNVREYDLVVFGGQVPPEKKIEMMHSISVLRPDVIFVQGLAGIPGLIVQQIEGAFAGNQDSERAPSYDQAKRAIVLSLSHSAAIKVTAWWQTTFVPPNPGSDSRVLVDGQFEEGDHTILVPDFVPEKASFASVQVGRAIFTFALK